MIKKILIAIGSFIASLLLAVGVLTCYFSTDHGQKWLYGTILGKLSESLQTRIDVKYIGVNILAGEMTLYGTEIDDLDGVTMLKVDTLEAGIKIRRLFDNHIAISHVKLAGAETVLYKEKKDTAANYQFILDRLKPKKKKPHKMTFAMELDKAEVRNANVRWDVRSERKKGGDTLDVNHLSIANFCITVKGRMEEKNTVDFAISSLGVHEKKSGMKLSAGKIKYRTMRQRNTNVLLEGVAFAYRDKRMGVKTLSFVQQHGFFDITKPMLLKAESFTFHNDNGKPRKNFNRPKRGAFDPGHLDAVLSMEATVQGINKDSILAKINSLSATDKASGLILKNVTADAFITKDKVDVRDLVISLQHSRLMAKHAEVDYTAKPTTVRVKDFPLTGKVLLQDIAKPFGPVLSNFTTPLNLSVVCGGTLDRFTFKNIQITTNDNRLKITAEGDLCDVTKKRQLSLHFNKIHLDARNGVKEQIVNHFSKKTRLRMLQQMKAIGNITYDGTLGVFYKRVDVAGTMHCKYTNVKFGFTINGKTKFMVGTLSTDSVNLGAIMDINRLWVGKTKATYSINTANRKHRTPDTRKGRLPIGWLKAEIDGARYKIAKVKQITTEINSDGVTAKGNINVLHSLLNVDATFDYVQTDDVQQLFVHPRIHLLAKAFKTKDFESNRDDKLQKEEKKEKKIKLLDRLRRKKKDNN